jgi:hypothetical protein
MLVKILSALATAAAALTFAGAAQAAPVAWPYKTDAQAAHYLETRLPTWAGYDLRTVEGRSAYCVNGYYSKHEQRTGRHYGRERVDRNGELRFRTFSCSLSFDDGADYRTFELYVQTRTAPPWHVSADR